MLSRTLKHAAYPIAYPIGNLKKDWYVPLLHLTQHIFSCLIGFLHFFFKFRLQKRSQLVEKNMQDSFNIMYLAWHGPILKGVFTNTLFACRFDDKSFVLYCFFFNHGFPLFCDVVQSQCIICDSPVLEITGL